jgi:hypothetical protein
LAWNTCTCMSVILNEVKDQPEVRNVYVSRGCRIVILHFVQDDKQTLLPYLNLCRLYY